MKKTTTFTCALLLFCFFGFSQTPDTLFFGFDNASEQEEWTTYKKGAEILFNEWQFEAEMFGEEPSVLAHYYPVGGMTLTKNWFVSKGYFLPEGGIVESIDHLYAGFGTPYNEDTIAMYILEGNKDPDLANAKTLIHLFTDSTYQNDNMWRTTNDIPFEGSTDSIYFAFFYQTIVNWLDVKFDNIKITKNEPLVNIEAVSPLRIEVYPNPAQEYVKLNIGTDVILEKLALLDLNGQLIKNFNVERRNLNVSNFENGIYFLLIEIDGVKYYKQLLVF